MAHKHAPVRHALEYAALRTVSGFMQCFDVDQNLHTAASIGSLFYRTNRTRRNRAGDNLRHSFPDWSNEKIERLVEDSMQHMFKLFLVDSLMMTRLITHGSWGRYIRLGNMGPMLERLMQRKPVIFITGHCGNWELLGYLLSVIGYPIAALARPLDNPYLNTWLLGIRESHGMQIITKWGATPELQNILTTGGQIGFIADQNAGDQGLFVPFFGRLASSYKSIGLLALRYDIPIVAGFARRIDGRFKFELSCVDYIEPDDWVDQPDPLFYVTARFNRAMETMVRSAPEQYLWLHRRWKSRPRHEREGREVPPKLIRKIESLPWMTPEELERIVGHSNALARNGSRRSP